MAIAFEYKFSTVHTAWGDFGIVTQQSVPIRTYLPDPGRKLETVISSEFGPCAADDRILPELAEMIRAYFQGKNVDFSSVEVDLKAVSRFRSGILRACRQVKFGQTISYGELALRAGFPRASRATGAALAANPLPLIIPCHRVIKSDGTAGGFSAAGQTQMKTRLIARESALMRK